MTQGHRCDLFIQGWAYRGRILHEHIASSLYDLTQTSRLRTPARLSILLSLRLEHILRAHPLAELLICN